MKNKVLVTILVLFMTLVSFAQNTKISGKIIDEKDATPIEFVTIRVLKNNVLVISNKNDAALAAPCRTICTVFGLPPGLMSV